MDDEASGIRIVNSGRITMAPTTRAMTWGDLEGARMPVRASLTRLVAVMTAITISGTIFLVTMFKADLDAAAHPPAAIWYIGAAGLLGLAAAVTWYLIVRATYLRNQNTHFDEIMSYQRVYEQEALEKLKKSTELATLMDLNQGQIKEYHRIVTQQADKSFRSSQTAMWVGIFMLVGCLIAGFYFNASAIRWFAAGVAAISATMSGYLTRTYLFMYKESVAQLNRYFDQPVLNSYYLTAERLSHGLSEETRQEMRRRIIDEVLMTSASMSGKKYEPEEAAAEKPKVPRQKKRKQKAPK